MAAVEMADGNRPQDKISPVLKTGHDKVKDSERIANVSLSPVLMPGIWAMIRRLLSSMTFSR